jgi:hypothetical protein
MSIHALLNRIRGEFREMPGLRLTLSEACRLSQLDSQTCEAVLRRLVDERFLTRKHDGTYLELANGPTPRFVTSFRRLA